MNTGEVKLTFNEPVNYAEFVPKNNIVIQASETGGSSYTITTERDTSVATYKGLIMSVTLNELDQLKLKANTGLALAKATTWISMNGNVVKDLSSAQANGVANQVVATTSAVQASTHTPDATKPTFGSIGPVTTKSLKELGLPVGFESEHASLDHFVNAATEHLKG